MEENEKRLELEKKRLEILRMRATGVVETPDPETGEDAAELWPRERRMQMDPKRFENTYTYHAPKGDQTARYEKLRAKARELAELIEVCCPDSREKSLAHTKVEEATMWANAAIARNE